MFLLLFGRDSSLPLRNYSKVEFKTRKEIKWFGELLLLHQPSKIRQDPCRIFLRLGKPAAQTSRKARNAPKAVPP